MCTPADDTLLIAGTSVGSLALFDLTDYASSSNANQDLDYMAMLKQLNPNALNEEGETNLQD